MCMLPTAYYYMNACITKIVIDRIDAIAGIHIHVCIRSVGTCQSLCITLPPLILTQTILVLLSLGGILNRKKQT